MYQSIITEIDQSVGILTLNRPDRHNALDDTLIDEIPRGLLELAINPGVRCIVLSSTGKTFCAGADINWLKHSTSDSPDDLAEEAHRLARVFTTLHELSKPTIARVQGPAYGGAVGLIAACDIAVATYDVQFALTDVKLGQVPAIVSPYVIEAIGARHARRYMLTAERFSAAEAYRLGLVHEVVPGDEQLDEAIAELIDSLMKNGPDAQAECKALLRAIAGQPIDTATRVETETCLTRVRLSDEGREGLAAFVEKRTPNWIV